MAQRGRPWTRLPVPSIGSIDHRRGPVPPDGLVFLAGDRVAGEGVAEAAPEELFEVAVEVGDVARLAFSSGVTELDRSSAIFEASSGEPFDQFEVGGERSHRSIPSLHAIRRGPGPGREGRRCRARPQRIADPRPGGQPGPGVVP